MRGLIFVILFGMLALATPAQAARELVCEGYGHTAERGNIRILVDCYNLNEIRSALERAYSDISRLSTDQHFKELCWRGIREAREASPVFAHPEYAIGLLRFCNIGFQYLPLAHEEVIPDLYRKIRFDNLNWQSFFTDMLNPVPDDWGGTCKFRIVRQPLMSGLDSEEIASGTAIYDEARIVLNLSWNTQDNSKSRRPDRARLAFDDRGGLSGEMKVFHLWGEENTRGTTIEINVPEFGRDDLDGRMFTAAVDDHWTIDVHLDACDGGRVEQPPADITAFEGDWSECPAIHNLSFPDEKTLRVATRGQEGPPQEYDYVVLTEEIMHRPTATRLAAGDLLMLARTSPIYGSVMRVEDGQLRHILTYGVVGETETNRRQVDSGFARRDGLIIAQGEGISGTPSPMLRGRC